MPWKGRSISGRSVPLNKRLWTPRSSARLTFPADWFSFYFIFISRTFAALSGRVHEVDRVQASIRRLVWSPWLRAIMWIRTRRAYR